MTNRGRSTVVLLRVGYWVGAIFDALTLVPMLVPRIGAAAFGLVNFNATPEYRYAMALAASLMLGWTLLLIWADRKPIERRGVLLLTVAVVIGLSASGAYAVRTNIVPASRMVPMWIWQGAITVFSYFRISAPGSPRHPRDTVLSPFA